MANGSHAVLVIDDDEKFKKSFAEMLQKMGFIVSVADTGEKAIETFSTNRSHFDLVILDLLMPDVDGSEIHELLRIQNPDIKILFASGIFYFDHLVDMTKSVINGFIQKPFNYYQLRSKIDRLLEVKLSGSFSIGELFTGI
jgi:DNA-binding NtrC family response regulator